jgi:hypothetical protein
MTTTLLVVSQPVACQAFLRLGFADPRRDAHLPLACDFGCVSASGQWPRICSLHFVLCITPFPLPLATGLWQPTFVGHLASCLPTQNTLQMKAVAHSHCRARRRRLLASSLMLYRLRRALMPAPLCVLSAAAATDALLTSACAGHRRNHARMPSSQVRSIVCALQTTPRDAARASRPQKDWRVYFVVTSIVALAAVRFSSVHGASSMRAASSFSVSPSASKRASSALRAPTTRLGAPAGGRPSCSLST